MIATTTGAIALATGLMLTSWSMRAAQSNPCALLTNAEAVKHIARGKKTYGETPDVTTVSGGSLCEYPFGGQIGVWSPPKAEENLERFLKAWRADKEKRHPMSGVGDHAWIMYPVPENQYKDRPAYLVTRVGRRRRSQCVVCRDGDAGGGAEQARGARGAASLS